MIRLFRLRAITLTICLALSAGSLSAFSLARDHGSATPVDQPGRTSTAVSRSHSYTHVSMATYSKLPLVFEANQGQTDPHVRFLARGPGYTLFLAPSEAILTLTRTTSSRPALQPRRTPSLPLLSATRHVVHLSFVDANPRAVVQGHDRLPGASNYFLGRDPRRWHTGLPTFARVTYRSIYPGIDLVYYGRQGRLEYDWALAPHADPTRIRLHVAGARRVSLDREGNLLLHLPDGVLRQHAPTVYQVAHGRRTRVVGRYVLRGRDEIGVRIGPYARSAPLVIDPVLLYSSYLGGAGDDAGQGIGVDSSGNIYVAGVTNSVNFPTANAAQGAYGGGANNAFVTKFSPSGAILYSTFLGGNAEDRALGIAVDRAGNAYVTGFTASTNFPTTSNALQGPPAEFVGSAFVTRLNTAGNTLLYSTYLRGTAYDIGNAIAADDAGNAYVTGVTASPDFPVANAAQSTLNGDTNAFVTRINTNAAGASSLVYSTFLGGSVEDQGNGIAVDGAGNAYVTGDTSSTDFPTVSPLRQSLGGTTNAFVAKINTATSGAASLSYSTYLGGRDTDSGKAIAVDGAGDAYVTGSTSSTDFPTVNPAQSALGGGACINATGQRIPCPDVFVARLNASGNGLLYSTYLGGDNSDEGRGIAIDSAGNAYVAGITSSTNFPTANPAGGTPGGGSDAFVAEINTAGNALLYGAYLGGSGDDAGNGVAVDSAGNVYVTGLTTSTNFPIVGALQGTNRGGYDAFVVKAGNIPTPTPANSPTITPVPPAATTTSPPPSSPTPTATPPLPAATATRTPSAGAPTATRTPSAGVPTATRTPSAGVPTTPAATPTPRPAFSPTPCPRRLAAPALIVTATRSVISGHVLTTSVRTIPGAALTVTVRVTTTRTTYTGTGKRRKRITRTVLLYQISTSATADSHGRYTAHLTITYKPASPAQASLAVTATRPCAPRASRAISITILPPLLTVTAAKSVRSGATLVVGIRTRPRARISLVLQVTTSRIVTVKKGKKTVRTSRTIVLYRVTGEGTAGNNGGYTGRLHVTYRPARAMPATLGVTARTTLGTATSAGAVTILPPLHPKPRH